MHGIDPKGAHGQVDHRLQRALLDAVLGQRAVFRQEVVARGEDAAPAEDHRAELPAAMHHPPVRLDQIRVDIEIGAEDPVMPGQMAGDLGRLVDHARALPEPLDLLQRNHVGGLDLPGDAGEIVAPVAAEAVLDVVGDELHRRRSTVTERIS